jgi:hypothetical protein
MPPNVIPSRQGRPRRPRARNLLPWSTEPTPADSAPVLYVKLNRPLSRTLRPGGMTPTLCHPELVEGPLQKTIKFSRS